MAIIRGALAPIDFHAKERPSQEVASFVKFLEFRLTISALEY
jgi:hypothetical protein